MKIHNTVYILIAVSWTILGLRSLSINKKVNGGVILLLKFKLYLKEIGQKLDEGLESQFEQ